MIELYNYMESNEIDIACVCETFLKQNHRIHSHPDYKLHRLDRDSGDKGGVAIMIKKELEHHVLPDLDLQVIESIGVQVRLDSNTKIKIFSVYLPGATIRSAIQQHLNNDIQKLTNIQQKYFICGDLNAKHRHWNCSRANLAGTILFNKMVDSNFMIEFPPSPTYYPEDPNRTPSSLDLVISNSVHDMTNLTCTDLASDHVAVYFEIQTGRNVDRLNRHRRLVPVYSKANWDRFHFLVARGTQTRDIDIDGIDSTDQVDGMIEHFTSVILAAEQASVPMAIPDPYHLQLTPEITELIKIKNMERRRWQRTRNVLFKQRCSLLREQIQHKISELRNANWNSRLEDIAKEKEPRRLFKVMKFCKNRDSKIPHLKVDSRKIITPQEKADLLADTFAKAHANPLATTDPIFVERVNSEVSNFISGSMTEIDLPTPEEIEGHIRALKPSKAPGKDGVKNRVIKRLPFQAILYLNMIFCACFKLGYFPSKWKSALVKALMKPGKDPSLAASYRPISLLSALSKLLERMILTRINSHTESIDLLPDEQYGFRPQRSTTQQLLRVRDQIVSGLNSGQSTGLLCFDIEKAFDRVWHAGLLFKMKQHNFPAYIVKITADFLRERQFQVAVESATSSSKPIPFGVPQGAVLSPALYNIYTSDVPKPSRCLTALFADDTALLCTSSFFAPIENSLQQAVQQFEEYFKKWKIMLNSSKTQAIFFTRRRTREIPQGPITISGVDVQWEPTAKYLGVVLDKKLTMKQHIEYVTSRAEKAIKILYPLLNRRSKLSVENKLLLFKLVLRPTYTYACPVFEEMAQTHYKKLQILQNKILKMALNLHWRTPTAEVHQEAEVETVAEFVARISNNLNSI